MIESVALDHHGVKQMPYTFFDPYSPANDGSGTLITNKRWKLSFTDIVPHDDFLAKLRLNRRNERVS